MKSLLVTTDFSANSKPAIQFALQMAARTGSDLIFYHVIELIKPTSWSKEKYAKFEAAKKDEFTTKLEEFVLSAVKEKNKDNSKFTYLTEIGTDVPELILKTAKKNKVAFICTSTKGAGNVKKLFGTNSSSLIMRSHIPLAIVPLNYKSERINKLFYASDMLSLKSEMKVVNQLAGQLNADTIVYHYDYMLQEGSSTKQLEKMAAPFAGKSVKFKFKRQEIDISLSDHLNRDIKKEEPSAIVLFTKQNRNWFDRLFTPSATANFSFNASVPLLVFRKKF